MFQDLLYVEAFTMLFFTELFKIKHLLQFQVQPSPFSGKCNICVLNKKLKVFEG